MFNILLDCKLRKKAQKTIKEILQEDSPKLTRYILTKVAYLKLT